MKMEHHKVQKVVVAGGGTAGWMAAASIAKLLGKTLDVTLIESDEIGTVGVGEATIPTLLTLHELLQIKEQDFVAAVQGTSNWVFPSKIGVTKARITFTPWLHRTGLLGAGFQHFWLKGKQLGLSEEFGNYCTELVAAQDNRFAVLPNNGLNYAIISTHRSTPNSCEVSPKTMVRCARRAKFAKSSSMRVVASSQRWSWSQANALKAIYSSTAQVFVAC